MKDIKTTFKCTSLKDTRKAAEFFTKFALAGQCFALFGNLGYGKTTFTKYFIKTLNPDVKEVCSPTFSIMQTYNFKNEVEIIHVDCYRLEKKEDFFDTGLEELFPYNIILIEWPEIIIDFLPQNTININFSINESGARIISSSI